MREKVYLTRQIWSFVVHVGLKMRGLANEKRAILFTFQAAHWKGNNPV